MSRFWSRAKRVYPPLTMMMAGRLFMLAALTTYLPIYMSNERGASLWLAAASLTILEAAGVVGALLTGTLSDRFGRKYVLLILLGSSPFFLLVFIYGPTILALPLLLILGLLAISPQPVMLALVQDQFPGNRALANGTFLAISFLVRALGIWMVGYLADLYGLNAAYTMAAVVALFSIPAIFLLPDGKP